MKQLFILISFALWTSGAACQKGVLGIARQSVGTAPTGPIAVAQADYDFLQTLSSNMVAGATATSTDGSATLLVYPDGASGYPWLFPRDYAYTVQGRPDLFTASQIEGVLEFLRTRLNASNHVADHIAPDGTAFHHAGPAWAPYGSRSPHDNQLFFVDIVYRHFQKTGSPAYWTAHKTTIKNIMSAPALPLNSSGVLLIPAGTSAGWPDYGFMDGVVKDGVPLFGNVLAYAAFKQLAEMATAAGDAADAADFTAKAATIKAYVNDNMFVTSTVSGQVHGLYKAATGLTSGQLDVWGSCFAVWTGLADSDKADAIARKLIYYKSADEYYNAGGFRHVFKSNDYTPGAKVWPELRDAYPYNSYQNGAYWHTPLPWVMYTVQRIDPAVASAMFTDAVNKMRSWVDGNSPYEWWYGSTLGVAKYVSSATLPFLWITPE